MSPLSSRSASYDDDVKEMSVEGSKQRITVAEVVENDKHETSTTYVKEERDFSKRRKPNSIKEDR